MNLAIWDIESSSSVVQWASIIEIGGVLIDENFKEIDRFNLRCRLPEGEVPMATALLVNKTNVDLLTKANLSHYQMLTEVEKILQPDFNIIDIDGGVYSTCLLRSDKTIWCWGGGNTHNQNSAPPAVQKVKGLPPMQSLEMGSGYTNCGKADNGGIWCWERQGRNARKIEYNAWTKSEANQGPRRTLG